MIASISSSTKASRFCCSIFRTPMRTRCNFCSSMCGSRWRKHPRESVVTLADFTGATVDHAVAMKIKEVLTLDRPFVKKTAWVGHGEYPARLHGKLPEFFPARDCDLQDAGRSDGLAGED